MLVQLGRGSALWVVAGASLLAQGGPEFTREAPAKGTVLGYRDGRLLVGRGVEGPGPGAVQMAVEDREGRTVREFRLGEEAREAGQLRGRFRMTTTALSASGEVVAGGASMEAGRRMENVMVMGAKAVSTGDFSCWVAAAASAEAAWCLGFYATAAGEESRHLLYRVGAEGQVAGHYALPVKTEQKTAEGLSRFPTLGLPGLWANADGSVWAWLPGDRKMARFDERTNRLEAWDVPVPKGGTAGVSVTVTSGNRVVALLPVSQDGFRVAPGPSPVFGAFELKRQAGVWERVAKMGDFRRGARLVGSDAGAVVVDNRETGRLEWWRLE